MEPGLLKSADWPVLIDLYFFLGGIAGGAFVIATIANLLGHERYRDIVRAGYYIAFLAVIPGPIILTVDLGLPTRFLHMLMVAKPSLEIGRDAVTVGPFHLKPFSPMNAGAWHCWRSAPARSWLRWTSSSSTGAVGACGRSAASSA